MAAALRQAKILPAIRLNFKCFSGPGRILAIYYK